MNLTQVHTIPRDNKVTYIKGGEKWDKGKLNVEKISYPGSEVSMPNERIL